MADVCIAVTPGQAFQSVPENIVSSSVSGSWQPIGAAVNNRHVDVQGIYWTSTQVGAVLQIRDPQGSVWYHVICTGGTVSVDILSTPLTLVTPFEYNVSGSSGATISIYGKYSR